MAVTNDAAPARRPRGLFAAAWALTWGLVGCLVAVSIVFVTRRQGEAAPVLITSVLFAEVVGFTSLLSTRVVFPMFRRLSTSVRFGLQAMTLFAGTVFGSVAVLASQPYYALANLRMVSVIVLVNAMLAVLTGFALFTYDTMRRQIEASYDALREKERLEREVAIAREVQHELLPRRLPDIRGLELSGRCVPAVGVGGDYYDFLPLAGDRLAIVIADVSGKGIPAALLMAGLQGSVRSIAVPGVPPAEVQARLNAMLHETTSAARYATCVFASWDGAARTLAYSNAGHVAPLHLCADGAVPLRAGGLPIGLLPESRYAEDVRVLAPGDVVAFVTDGVVEAPDLRGNEFGEERLIAILDRHRGEPLDAILDRVGHEVEVWRGGAAPHDDLTIVLVRAT